MDTGQRKESCQATTQDVKATIEKEQPGRQVIRDWWYDDGKPIWSELLQCNLDDGMIRRPAWHCKIYSYDTDPKPVIAWLEANYVEEQDYFEEFRLNSGSPALFITLYNEQILTAFKLTWEQ